jgi:beta-glucuronidase
MLSAVTHSHRDRIDLAGMWDFRTDPQGVGESERWFAGAGGAWDKLYVPANWNEQREAYDAYMGLGWYRRRFFVSEAWQGRVNRLVVEGALHTAAVWVNEQLVAQHDGGFTPFEADVSDSLKYGQDNWIIVAVDDTVSLETVPQGTDQETLHIDWFNWGGLYRPIYLEAVSPPHLEDLTIRTMKASAAEAQVRIEGLLARPQAEAATVQLTLFDPEGRLVVQAAQEQSPFTQTWTLPNPSLWTPDNPARYALHVDVLQGSQVCDHVEFTCGLRTVEVRDQKLYMNDELFFLKGISRVEDAAMQGRAGWGPVPRRDHDLLKSLGAHFYRPAGYCPAIPDVTLGDETGVCVSIDIPCFGKWLPESLDDPKLVAKAQRWLTEAVAVYKNHPSVLFWDLATGIRTVRPGGRHYIKTLHDTAHRLDPTRPTFYVRNQEVYKQDQAQDIVDMLCLWMGRRLHTDWEEGVKAIDEEIEWMHQRYPEKPMIIYFGDVAIAGLHADPPTWQSEEFQAKYFEWAWQYAQTKPYIVAFWWWCLCDYRCRALPGRKDVSGGLLRWGIHDRLRQPKLAARHIREAYPTRPTLRKE